jgi:plasmid stabilization system protein ParE
VSRVRFHRAATEEAEAAVRWYNERVSGLGDDFGAELLGAVGRVVRTPMLWPSSAFDRRARHYCFPASYAIIYVIAPDTSIVVMAVAHGRRRPRYWIGRF